MDLHTILDGVQQAAPYVLALLFALTALAHAAQSAARAFHRWALTTPTEKDDAIAEWLVDAADAVAAALDWIGAWLPQIAFGRRSLGSSAPPAPPPSGGSPPRPPGVLSVIRTLALAALAGVVFASTGCSVGPPFHVHTSPVHISVSYTATDGGTISDSDTLVDRSSAESASTSTGISTQTRDISPSVSVPVTAGAATGSP